MTQENGRVVVTVNNPVLGQVNGTRALADVAAGKSEPDPFADEPAVKTSDLPSK